jgi:hypothetical protein
MSDTYTEPSSEQIAVKRYSERFVPQVHPADAEASKEFDSIAMKEETSFAEATKGIEPARDVTKHLAEARKAAQAKADAYAKVRQVPPSDREHYRKIADDMADGSEFYRKAEDAVAVLGQEAGAAALPPAPSRREYPQIADELRMLLNGKTKDQVVDIATRPRYVGLMAREFGLAWCEANLDKDLAQATHEAIVAKATGGVGSQVSTAAKRVIFASRHADHSRLRAAGAK